MPAKRKIVIGSRGSRLALWQANHVKKLLEEEYQDLSVAVKVIKTTGDKVLSKPLAEIGGKGLFLKEIEEQILAGKVQLGVHSLKDVPAVLPTGLLLTAVLKREDPRDVFVSKKYASLLHLPKKAKVGTSSLRRKAQLKNFRPDFEILPMRGNVETRLRKLQPGKLDAIVLASAGLSRLGLASKITEYLPTTLMLPAVGQGVIALEIRDNDDATRRLLDPLNDQETMIAIQAERAFMKAVEGNCQAPIAAYAEVSGQGLKITGMIASPDGRELIRDRMEGNIRESASLGDGLAKQLLGHGGREILRACKSK
ncbi:MAG TPA: hydroxymethylbilane synthase [bacterium]|nr:hydroxymethylbilane synthase [bacterium]